MFMACDVLLLEITHQEKSIRLARLAADMPDTTRLPYLVWRHNDGQDAIIISRTRIDFWCVKSLWQ